MSENFIKLTFLLVGAFWASMALTGRVRRYALRKNLLDIPNERSSHSEATPLLGGLAIVAVSIVTLAVLWLGGLRGSGSWVLLAYVAGGLMVAGVGYLDDFRHVAPTWRLLVHFTAAAGVLATVGELPAFQVFGHELNFGPFAPILTATLIVWLLNLYNFMDGIDGIAGIEAVTVAGAAAVLLWSSQANSFAVLAAVLAAVSLGFLVWNWPPAEIFMGDIGSGFLGFCFGALMVMTFAASVLSIWVWLILLGTFCVDATVTLIFRILRREAFYKPHRSHAYQHASRKLKSHRRVTVAVGAINLLWLAPFAFAVNIGFIDGFLALLIAYSPLVALAVHFRAGAN